MYIAEKESELLLTCVTSGFPEPSVYWVKDGLPLSMNLFNSETNRLEVTPNNVTNQRLHGVYQCFAENSAGVEVTMTRVLIEGEFPKGPVITNCFVLVWEQCLCVWPTVTEGIHKIGVVTALIKCECSVRHAAMKLSNASAGVTPII